MNLSKIWINLVGLINFRRFVIAHMLILDVEKLPSCPRTITSEELVNRYMIDRQSWSYLDMFVLNLKTVWNRLWGMTIYFSATTVMAWYMFTNTGDPMSAVIIISAFNGCITFPIVLGIRDKLLKSKRDYALRSTQGYPEVYG